MNTDKKPEYIPYGDEWEKELMKMPKKGIIELYRTLAKKHSTLNPPAAPAVCEGREREASLVASAIVFGMAVHSGDIEKEPDKFETVLDQFYASQQAVKPEILEDAEAYWEENKMNCCEDFLTKDKFLAYVAHSRTEGRFTEEDILLFIKWIRETFIVGTGDLWRRQKYYRDQRTDELIFEEYISSLKQKQTK